MKEQLIKHALKDVESNMVLGLGSGSTMEIILEGLSVRIEKGLKVVGVSTSDKTTAICNRLGIPLTQIEKARKINIAIDGANEIDSDLNLIKGGGGSLLREKVVDCFADQLIIVADSSKKSEQLGSFDLPLEVAPFCWKFILKQKLSELECTAKIRTDENGEIFVTDNNNYILDCKFNEIQNPKELHQNLINIVGVYETGLFVNVVDKVILMKNNDVEIFDGK